MPDALTLGASHPPPTLALGTSHPPPIVDSDSSDAHPGSTYEGSDADPILGAMPGTLLASTNHDAAQPSQPPEDLVPNTADEQPTEEPEWMDPRWWTSWMTPWPWTTGYWWDNHGWGTVPGGSWAKGYEKGYEKDMDGKAKGPRARDADVSISLRSVSSSNASHNARKEDIFVHFRSMLLDRSGTCLERCWSSRVFRRHRPRDYACGG